MPARILAHAVTSIIAVSLYATACLPSEPADGGRVAFELDFEQPYRVPLSGVAQPLLRISANGQILQAPNYRLESLDPSLVQVDPTGRGLRGMARGTANVRVIYPTTTGASDTTFRVHVVVSRVAVAVGEATLSRLGDTVRLAASAFDANDEVVPNVQMTWTSADHGVATVSPSGVVTARSDGAAMVVAEADGVSDSAAVTVVQAAAKVQIVPELDTLRTVGRATRFLAVAFDDTGGVLRMARPRWRSSDEHVARVDSTGLAIATGGGTARIIAQIGTAADTATLAVSQVTRFLVVAPALDTLTAIDDTTRITALAFDSLNFPIPNPTVTWLASDMAVARVDDEGLVRAARTGVVLVTASAAGQSAFATVVVHQDVARARISPDNVTLTGAGDTVRLTVVGLDHNGYAVPDASFGWLQPGSTCAATLDHPTSNTSARITARGTGKAAIIAVATKQGLAAGLPDTAVVSVTGAPSSEPVIAFRYSERGILANCASGGSTVLIADTHESRFYSPAWSPDGERIAFVRIGSGCAEIYTARYDGTEPRRVIECGGDPDWSPDGGSLAFSRNGALYLASADGSNVRRVGGFGGGNNVFWRNPTWSPDGTRLGFLAQWTDRSQGDAIAVVNTDGTGFTILHRLGQSMSDYGNPAWSPDGSQIAFDAFGNLHVINADGSGLTTLITPSLYPDCETGFFSGASEPAWSPDGKQIIYAGLVYPGGGGSCTWHVFLGVVNLDGTPGTGPTGFCCGVPPAHPTWRRMPSSASALPGPHSRASRREVR